MAKDLPELALKPGHSLGRGLQRGAAGRWTLWWQGRAGRDGPATRRSRHPRAYPIVGAGSGKLDQELRLPLWRSPALRERHALLCCVPGAGPQLSVALPADVPEPGAMGRRQIDAKVRVA